MSRYIATFYSHYGALQYCRALESLGVVGRPMPVPRRVSSSCGTCVSYEHDTAIDRDDCELECVYAECDEPAGGSGGRGKAGGALECVLRK